MYFLKLKAECYFLRSFDTPTICISNHNHAVSRYYPVFNADWRKHYHFSFKYTK